MNSLGHIALRAWLESLGATSIQLDRFMTDESLLLSFIQRLLRYEWSSNIPMFLEILDVEISHGAFVELTEDIAEQSLLGEGDAIVQLFALSNNPEYHSHLQFLINLRSAFYSLERSKLRKRAAEIEDELNLSEHDLEVAFLRVEASEMKKRLKEIEDSEFGGMTGTVEFAAQASLVGARPKENLDNDLEEWSQPTRFFRGKFLLRVAAMVAAILGGVWIFWPEKESEFADKGGEIQKSETLETLDPQDSIVNSIKPNSEGNAPTIENAFDQKTNVSPAPPKSDASYIASYEILGEVNRGFGFSKKRSIAVEVLSSMSQLEVYNIQGDTLRLYVNDLNAFRNGTIIDLDKCLKENGSNSDCVFYVATQSGFYSIKWVQSQEPLQSVQDEQLITILKSYQP